MAEFLGRDFTFGSATDSSISMCFRTIGISSEGEPIDITDSCSNGFTEYSRRGPATRQITLSVEGIAKSAFMRDLVLGDLAMFLDNFRLNWPAVGDAASSETEGASLTADWVISSYAENGTQSDVVTFSATIMSSGPWVYVAEGA